MATKYWVGGNGNWSSATNWRTTSGGVVITTPPGSADAAVLDANSSTSVVTVDSNITIQTLTCTGFTGTLAFGTNTISLNSTGTIFTGDTTYSVTGTPLIICTNSSATARTISPTAVTEANSISFRITAGTGSFTVTTSNSVRDIDFTDGTNPTGFQGSYTSTPHNIYGSLKASTGMSVGSGTSTFTFLGTSGTKTINTAGVTFDRPFTFNGAGGTFQLASALTSGASRTCTLTNGTLDLNNYTLTIGLFSSSNSNTRTLAFGTGKIVITGNNATVFNTNLGTNLTITGSKRVEYNYSGSTGTRQIGGTSSGTAVPGTNTCSHYITAGTDIANPIGSRSYETIDCTGFGGALNSANAVIYGDLVLSSVSTFSTSVFSATFASTTSQTITSNNKTIDGDIVFNGVGGSWTLQDNLTVLSTYTTNLIAGTLGLNSKTLTTGSFTSSNSNTRSIAFGTGKIVLTGNSATVWTNATGTGFSYTGTSRIEALGPATTGTRVLNPSTIATSTESIALSFYITGGSDTVNFGTTNRRVYNMDFTGFTGTFTNSAQTVHGSYTIASGMTVGSGTNVTTFASTTSQTITSNGKTLGFPITFDGVGGTWTCTDALNIDGNTLTLTNGTLQLAAGTTSTVGMFATSGTNQKYLQSSTAGTQATISDASGTNSVSYLTIQDINATGGATWQAYITDQNVNNGNNTGWDFYVQVGRVMYTRRKNKRYFL